MIELNWSPWIPLDSDLQTYQEHIATAPGFYRVRAANQNSLVYIGQTGRSLRQRTRTELSKQVMRPLDSPPWNDPHTAAPSLWAFRHEDGMEFEVSVAVADDLTAQLRQCYEDALLYLHRREFGHSTLCNPVHCDRDYQSTLRTFASWAAMLHSTACLMHLPIT